jgi:phosphoglycolate phosphatase
MAAGSSRIEAVLFDLDGTLIDSAPDLLAALDHVRSGLGLPGADHSRLREYVTRGAAGLLEAGLGDGPGDAVDREVLRDRLLDYYAENCWVRSEIFAGIEPLLDALEDRGVALGIVTNKVSRFADPVVERAGWSTRFGALITGDRVTRPKPDPEGLLAACARLEAAPERTLFVGDDLRDVQAGRSAGMPTVVAAWGYLPAGEDGGGWRADGIIRHPLELMNWPGLASAA